MEDKEKGYWFTTENGVHIHAEEGETPKEATEKKFEKFEKKDYQSTTLKTPSQQNANSGYVGHSMSVRAKLAYESGEKPMSKWSKDDILDGIENMNDKLDLTKAKKLNTQDLKDLFLRYSSWHHTGQYFNNTNFYSIIDDLDNINQEDFDKMVDDYLETKNQPEPQFVLDRQKKDKIMSKYKGDVSFTEWEGNGKRKTPKDITIKDADIEKKGDWTIITKDGQTIKKKSYNVNVFNKVYNEEQKEILRKEEKERQKRELSSFNDRRDIDKDYGILLNNLEEGQKQAVKDWLNELVERNNKPIYETTIDKNGIETKNIKNYNLTEYSQSGNLYEYGRKPTKEQAQEPSSFFKKGEKRLFFDRNNYKNIFQMWNGQKWVEYNSGDDADKKQFTNFDKKGE